MAKMMSRDALQRLVLEQLKAVPGCEGARCVVITIPTFRADRWRRGTFDALIVGHRIILRQPSLDLRDRLPAGAN
jgi:hypothetical protein